MATELTTQTEMDAAAGLLFLPRWLTENLTAVAGQNRETLKAVSLNSQEKRWLQEKIFSLTDSLNEAPDAEKTMNLIGDFLLTYSPPGLNTDQAKARGRAYMIALADIPAWCVAEAINRWHRGELISDASYAWPIPPTLRKAALDVKSCTEGRVQVFIRLLTCSSLAEFSDEYRLTMLEKVKGLFTTPKKAF